MKDIIEIKELKKYFKDVKAVDGISFCVKEGELLLSWGSTEQVKARLSILSAIF